MFWNTIFFVQLVKKVEYVTCIPFLVFGAFIKHVFPISLHTTATCTRPRRPVRSFRENERWITIFIFLLLN